MCSFGKGLDPRPAHPSRKLSCSSEWQLLVGLWSLGCSAASCGERAEVRRVVRLPATDASGAGGGMERWAVDVRESSDLRPLVPPATRLAAGLEEAGRNGRLLELLPGCQIVDCRPLL